MVEVSTKKLVEELMNRQGVSVLEVPPHQNYQFSINGDKKVEKTGPTIVLIIED
ncbi:BC1881 family protein [Brevibacillus sp. HB2.2]|uniref:BC1881 family protein n=1 Tax=Brevibacillus sp. HB2.2 TaxID=2738846 RepID=UPI00156B2E9C|nr:BC1881 family protein [Brevibacillus sp. HB2.2]NRS51953.1 BC1881 family protein [Brevibacillus sp. HB2.2]